MNDIEALNTFEKHGKAAEFLFSSGRPAAAEQAERRINAIVAMYHTFPHLQDKFHDISLTFRRWSLIAAVEQRAYLARSEIQRGIRA